MTSTSTPCGTRMTTMVTVPSSTPDLVCWTALVTISDVFAGTRTDDGVPAHEAQVREGNFSAEIPDGISSMALARYRTACQGPGGVVRLPSDDQIGSRPVSSVNSLAVDPRMPHEEASFSCLLALPSAAAVSAPNSGACAKDTRLSSRK